jgi:steroid delta-isomerase-like uncharacterized protein
MSGNNDNVELNKRWIEAYNNRDLAAEAAARTPDFVAHIPGMPVPLNSDAWVGFVMSFADAFPDLRLTVEQAIADDDMVACRVRFDGTHQGDFQGLAATGRRVTFSSMEFNRIADGKIAEHWVVIDLFGLLQQLGAVPSPA